MLGPGQHAGDELCCPALLVLVLVLVCQQALDERADRVEDADVQQLACPVLSACC
jgi:hypothetical protein